MRQQTGLHINGCMREGCYGRLLMLNASVCHLSLPERRPSHTLRLCQAVLQKVFPQRAIKACESYVFETCSLVLGCSSLQSPFPKHCGAREPSSVRFLLWEGGGKRRL